MNALSALFVRFAAKIIAVDDTVVPYEQLRVVQDMLKAQRIELDSKDARKLLNALARKHLVNGITVLKPNSNIVFSSSGNGAAEAEAAASLFRFLNTSASKPDAVAVKHSREWSMLLPSNGKIFVVNANSSLSTVELRAIARDTEVALAKRLQL